jgi:hypothetical protein
LGQEVCLLIAPSLVVGDEVSEVSGRGGLAIGTDLARTVFAAVANSSALEPYRRSTVWTVTPARSAMTGRDTSSYGRSANKARAAAVIAWAVASAARARALMR